MFECCSLPIAAIYWRFEGTAHDGEHDGLREAVSWAVSASRDQRESLITSAARVTGPVGLLLSVRLRITLIDYLIDYFHFTLRLPVMSSVKGSQTTTQVVNHFPAFIVTYSLYRYK